MDKKGKIPIRLKILITVLVVLTAVVGLITLNMAKMFHTDKRAYIHDLTSVVAVHASEEARSLLIGYGETMSVFARFIYREDLFSDQKASMLRELFEDFRDFVSVTVYEGGKEQVTIYNSKTLKEANLRKGDLKQYRSNHLLPFDKIRSGKIYVENSTLSNKLPCMTMAFPLTAAGKKRAPVISAVIRLDKLLRIARRSKVFGTFIVDGKGALLAHIDIARVSKRAPADWFPKLEELRKGQMLSTAVEFVEDGVEVVGGFAHVDIGNLVVGTKIPKAAAFLTARSLLKDMFGLSLVILSVAALLSLLWARRMTRPIERLSSAAGDVGKGQFDVQISIDSRDEIGMLAGSFNRMTSELKTREEALTQAQVQLVHSEKMAAFGQLGAGIAHEVKNPLAGILGYTQLSLRKMNKEDVLYKNLEIIEKETKRCRTIIDNLLRFARQEKVIFEPIEINRVADDAMAIVDHQLGMHRIKQEKEMAQDLPRIMGNGNQIQQVLMNIIINAQQAMDGKPGSIKVSTRLMDTDLIELRISDTGPGIPEEVMDKLFEPFFSTKPAGKGTGLGLSVSYGIIKDHKGDILVESEEGKGTTFLITLPVMGSEGAPPAHYSEPDHSDKSENEEPIDEGK